MRHAFFRDVGALAVRLPVAGDRGMPGACRAQSFVTPHGFTVVDGCSDPTTSATNASSTTPTLAPSAVSEQPPRLSAATKPRARAPSAVTTHEPSTAVLLAAASWMTCEDRAHDLLHDGELGAAAGRGRDRRQADRK